MRLSDCEILNKEYPAYGVVHKYAILGNGEPIDGDWECCAWYGRGEKICMQSHMVGDVFITTKKGTESMLVGDKMKNGMVVHNCPIHVALYTKDLEPGVMNMFLNGCERMDYEDIIYSLNKVAQISDSEFNIISISECNITL